MRLLLALCLLASCATRKYAETHHQAQEQATFQATAVNAVESKRADETKASERKAGYRRKTTPSPAGPIVEEEWSASLSELQQHSGVVVASRSESRTEAETSKASEASASKMSDRKPAGFALPWWAWVGLVVFLGGWAVRIAWKQGWRPWRR